MFKNKIKNNKAFTLIELLVVISIIGLLSTVVLASLNTARDKARLGAGKYFDASTYHAYGADEIYTYWSFNNTASIGADSAGSSYNLTTTGTVTSVPGVFGNAVNFNDSSGASDLSFTVPSTSGLSDINTNGGTLSLWIRPVSYNSVDGYSILFTGVAGGSNRMYVQFINAGNLVRLVRGSDSAIINLGTAKLGEWNHLALSWTAGNIMKGYYNGKKIEEKPYLGNDDLASITIGRQSAINEFYGDVDEVRIYSHVLADAEIESQYLAGLENIRKGFAVK